jgi:hypothetical protein
VLEEIDPAELVVANEFDDMAVKEDLGLPSARRRNASINKLKAAAASNLHNS